jgi:uncharacterized protein involved in type VI secretion and phage assembly
MDGALLDAVTSRHYGKYRGQVVDNQDPTARGRLQVVAPALLGSQPVWAMPSVPYAGSNVGFFAMPPIGAGVWVEFEGGDLDLPIWSGCFWADGEIASGDAKANVKFWITDRVSIRIDDQAGEIVVKTSGATLTMTATEVTVEAATITEKAAASQTKLSSSGLDVNNGAFTVI